MGRKKREVPVSEPENQKKINSPFAKKEFTYFSGICYPDSCPNNFVDLLTDKGFIFCLILHDKDVITDVDVKRYPNKYTESDIGTLKKPHYHVLLDYLQPTTFQYFCDTWTACTNSEIHGFIENKKNMANAYYYLDHINEEHKYLYDHDEILHFNGFDISRYTDIMEYKSKDYRPLIIRAINTNMFLEWKQLVDWAIENDDGYLVAHIWKYSYVYSKYIDSFKYSLKPTKGYITRKLEVI